MKKALPIALSLVLGVSALIPHVAFASIGANCQSLDWCDSTAEYCNMINAAQNDGYGVCTANGAGASSECTGDQVWNSAFQTCVSPSVNNAVTNTSTGGNAGGSGALNLTRVQGWVNTIVLFINFGLMPLLIAVATITFFWGAFRYFIYGGDNDENRKTGRALIMYGILGFVIIFSLWGIVNVGVSILNLPVGGRPGNLPYPSL